jgi:hypothetical protein
MRNTLVVALIAASALAACDRAAEGGDQQGLTNWQKAPPLRAGVDEGATPAPEGAPAVAVAGTDAAAAPAAAAASIPAAAAGSVPVRKAGLWKTTVNTGRGGAQTGELCVDDQSELRRGVFAQTGGGRAGGQGCTPRIAKQGANWTYSMSCTRNFGDASMKMSSSQTLTGDLTKSYQLKGTTTTSGGPNEDMNGSRNISASGTYVGPCPAGMRPGDFKGADGQVRNVMQQGQGRGPGGGRRDGGSEGGRRGGDGG